MKPIFLILQSVKIIKDEVDSIADVRMYTRPGCTFYFQKVHAIVIFDIIHLKKEWIFLVFPRVMC